MLKYLFRIVFLFLMFAQVEVYAQTPADTTSGMKDPVALKTDSLTPGMQSSDSLTQVLPAEIKEDSIYMPVKDSAYLNAYNLRAVPQSKVDNYLAEPEYAYAN